MKMHMEDPERREYPREYEYNLVPREEPPQEEQAVQESVFGGDSSRLVSEFGKAVVHAWRRWSAPRSSSERTGTRLCR